MRTIGTPLAHECKNKAFSYSKLNTMMATRRGCYTSRGTAFVVECESSSEVDRKRIQKRLGTLSVSTSLLLLSKLTLYGKPFQYQKLVSKLTRSCSSYTRKWRLMHSSDGNRISILIITN